MNLAAWVSRADPDRSVNCILADIWRRHWQVGGVGLLDENWCKDADDDLVPILDLRQRVVEGVQVGRSDQSRALWTCTSKWISRPERDRLMSPIRRREIMVPPKEPQPELQPVGKRAGSGKQTNSEIKQNGTYKRSPNLDEHGSYGK